MSMMSANVAKSNLVIAFKLVITIIATLLSPTIISAASYTNHHSILVPRDTTFLKYTYIGSYDGPALTESVCNFVGFPTVHTYHSTYGNCTNFGEDGPDSYLIATNGRCIAAPAGAQNAARQEVDCGQGICRGTVKRVCGGQMRTLILNCPNRDGQPAMMTASVDGGYVSCEWFGDQYESVRLRSDCQQEHLLLDYN